MANENEILAADQPEAPTAVPPRTAEVDRLSETPRPKGALIRSIVTVVLLVGLPLFGLIALWTISPWSRRARVVLTVVFVVPAIYYPILVMSALVKAAL